MNANHVLTCVIASMVSGCQGYGNGEFRSRSEGAAIGNSSALTRDASLEAEIARADWTRVVDVRIELRDYGFNPAEVRMKAGQPYRLTVVNIGGHSHYFNAPDFLRGIATRQVDVKDQVEVKGQNFSSFEVARRGGSFTIEFVPLVKGSYRAHCHLEGDPHRGVEGRIIVQ